MGLFDDSGGEEDLFASLSTQKSKCVSNKCLVIRCMHNSYNIHNTVGRDCLMYVQINHSLLEAPEGENT